MMTHSSVCNFIQKPLLLITATKQVQKAFETSGLTVLNFRFKILFGTLRYSFDTLWPVLEYTLKQKSLQFTSSKYLSKCHNKRTYNIQDIIQPANISKEIPYCINFSVIGSQLRIKLENYS